MVGQLGATKILVNYGIRDSGPVLLSASERGRDSSSSGVKKEGLPVTGIRRGRALDALVPFHILILSTRSAGIALYDCGHNSIANIA